MAEDLTKIKTNAVMDCDLEKDCVLVSSSDEQVQSALVKQLKKRNIEKICFRENDDLIKDISSKCPAVIFAGVDEYASEIAATARENGYRGAIVAVISENNKSAAMASVRAGADHALIIPEREIEFDIILEKISAGYKPEAAAVDQLKRFLGPVGQGVILVDGNRDMLFSNKSARGILNANSEKEVSDFIKDKCNSGFFTKSRSQQSAIAYMDIRLPEGEGHKLLGLEGCYLEISKGHYVYLILLHDFSEWKRLDQLRSSFVTSLSHRLRTPLTSIRNVVKILTGNNCTDQGEGKEKLLNIGWRNIEKLISNLDELQKIFMIESEEMNVCRTMFPVKAEIERLFENLQKDGTVKGFKLSIPDISIFTEGGRLSDFVSSVIDAYKVWLSEPLFIECSSSIREEVDLLSRSRKRLNIYFRPRINGRNIYSRDNFQDFLSFDEAHRRLVMERLVTALNGRLEISTGSTITLSIPLDPPFDRKKDLVHPLHMMIERADIAGVVFNLIDLSLSGRAAGNADYTDLLRKELLLLAGCDGVISRGDDDSNYILFLTGRDVEEVESMMTGLRAKLHEICRSNGEEGGVDLTWDIKFDRQPGDSESVIDDIVLTTLV
ncbi:MAG: hypothetical protein JW746_06585 [Candidatus Krumholzibacteriota bacterium]|nr:hypothetical protein [Candidatus Krumholzibacteriota bacterium]